MPSALAILRDEAELALDTKRINEKSGDLGYVGWMTYKQTYERLV